MTEQPGPAESGPAQPVFVQSVTEQPGPAEPGTVSPDAAQPADPPAVSVADLRFGPDGLICAVAQQFDTREVLMVAWMDAEAVRRTLETGAATYFSRSRQQQWVKGETSGNTQRVVQVRYDCDADTLLVLVDQKGPACHTGTRSCFENRVLAAQPKP